METQMYSSNPLTVYMEILYGCNLYCSYCYIGRESNHIKPVVPSLEIITNILCHLRKEKVEELVLLGGEPMLHPHFTYICSAIAEMNFPSRGIVTNGTVVSSKKAELLRDLGFWVDISFRGPSASTFDNISGKVGSFQKAFDASLLLSDIGVPVGLEFDCIPQNYNRLYETVEMLVKAGARINQLQLHRIMPEGDAKYNMEEFFLTLEQWLIVFDQAYRIHRELSIPVIFEDGFPLCLVRHEYWDIITPCPCGFTSLTVNPIGDVRHCTCHGKVLGNVLRDPLTKIWEHSLQDYRAHTRHYAACLECEIFEVCRGGCSASGNPGMNEGQDVFHEHFRPVKLNNEFKPETTLILRQSICNYNDFC